MRRTLFIFLLAGLIFYGLQRVRHSGAFGFGDETRYTLAEGSRIDVKDVQVLAALDAEYSNLVDAVVPSVVSIASRRVDTRRFTDPFDFFQPRRRGPAPQVTQMGSGVIVTKEGHILTNHHVIADMNDIQVQLTDGRTEPAKLIGSDEQTDIAVIKINAANIKPLPFGDSDGVRVGQLVFAVGNPFGLQESVTQGIISAKGRRAMRDSGVEFLQTDAAVNQGNSGGPLLNVRGEIIGINSAIYSETGGWLGISFAIPSNVARRGLESLIKTGRVSRGYLGVMMMNVTPELAREFGAPDTNGALITDVIAGSPADRAGLKSGDIIKEVNGRETKDSLAVRSRIADVDLGGKLDVAVLREGQRVTVSAEIAEVPDALASSTAPPQPPSAAPLRSRPRQNARANVLSGVQVIEIPAAMRQSALEKSLGVMVEQIAPGTPAAATLRPGDIIEEINQQKIASLSDYEKIADTLSIGEKALLYVLRGANRSFVVLTP